MNGLDEQLNAWFAPLADWLTGWVFFSLSWGQVQVPLILGWLIAAGVVFTIALRGIQWRGFGHALRLTRGDYTDPASQGPGETSHFQALTMALSGTVGLGNIAGVAVAVGIGGPGATLWMVVAGILAMATKFVECLLGVRFRSHHPDGSVSGGPMHYLSKGLALRGWPRLGQGLAWWFAICCIGGALGGGNMFQANQAFGQVLAVTGGSAGWWADRGWLFGLLLVALLAAVVVGGARGIARTTARLVPAMALLYVGAGAVVLLVHADRLPSALGQIVTGAFSAEGVVGGAVGALIQGFRRAAFSNEAGIGSAAIAHATVRTHEPVTEGYVGLLEPFIDTVVICTMTALVIVLAAPAAPADGGLSGVQLTSAAFAQVLPVFPLVLAVVVVLFAFSTLLTWFYYGLKCWTYLFGAGVVPVQLYRVLYMGATVLGASAQLGPVIDFSDAMIFLMAVPNVIGLYLLLPLVRADVQDYEVRLLAGQLTNFRRAGKTPRS